jgi:hypothetical protein
MTSQISITNFFKIQIGKKKLLTIEMSIENLSPHMNNQDFIYLFIFKIKIENFSPCLKKN